MDYLEQLLLEIAKDHLKSLSDAEFLALTCNLTSLHDGLIRQVYNQALARKFRAPLRVTAENTLWGKSRGILLPKAYSIPSAAMKALGTSAICLPSF